ncbi:MAG: LEPR-XLL domain-containing protein [Halioglobus sp.]
MAYPFHRIDGCNGLDIAAFNSNPSNPFRRSRFSRAPSWQRFQSAHRANLMEPLEPRLLLSADFMPAAADAMADGFDDFQDRLEEFFAAELDQRVPFLLVENPLYDEENPDPDDAPFEAPEFLDLFSIPVDANGDGDTNGLFDTSDDDEGTLDLWDTSGDGIVDAAELLDALLFAPLQDFLRTEVIEVPTQTETGDFVVALEGLPFIRDGFDVVLGQLGPDYTLDFDLVSATDLTEDPDAEVAFDFQFTLSITHEEVQVDLGLEADDLKLLAFTGPNSLNPGPVTIPITSSLSFGLEFGVYTGGQNDSNSPADLDLNAADFFIRRADDMVFSITDNLGPGDVNFELNIGFLGADVVGGSVDFQADILATLIDPDSPAVLGFDAAQYGVEQPGGVLVAVVEAANPIPDEDLPHDAGFVLRIGNLGIASDITVVDDDNNTTNANLVADVQDAIDALPGLGDLITVDLTGSDELQFSLVSTDPSDLGFNEPENLSKTGLLNAPVAPTIQPASDVAFLLSLGGALPSLVTVRAPGPEQEDIGFAANEVSELAPLVASGALNPTGTIGGDLQADLTLRVFLDDGSFKDVVVMVAEIDVLPDPNTTPAELFADFNTALGSALVSALLPPGTVSASESGGVITLTGGGTVSAIEVFAVDAESPADLGFSLGQKTLLSLTADNPITDFAFSGVARLIVTVNGVDHDIDFAGEHASQGALATAIDNVLGVANGGLGLPVTASVVADKIVLTADNTDVYELFLTTVNQDLDDLVYDLNNALDLAGFATVTAGDDGGGNIRLTETSTEPLSLEITNTLTFDAGVRGVELDGTEPDASFDPSVGDDSELFLNLPVVVEAGLREAGEVFDWLPEDMAIVGKFNPLDSSLSTFVEDEPDNEDPLEFPQEVLRFFLDYDVTSLTSVELDALITDLSDPANANTLQLVNFAEALQFNRIGPGSFIGMLEELGAALDSIMQDPLFAGYDIPFTDATLSDIVAFEDMILNSMIYDKGPDGEFDDEDYVDDDLLGRLLTRTGVGDVVVPDGTPNPEANAYEPLPTFTTAQGMGERLGVILSLPVFSDTGGINPTYDPGTNELTYDMDLISSDRVSVGVDVPFTSNFEFDVDLAPFGEFLIKPAGVELFGGGGNVDPADLLVTIEARTTFSATYGFDLTPHPETIEGVNPFDLSGPLIQVPVPEDALEERFFVRNATLGGAFIATLPDVGVEASALVGIIGVDITDIDGTFGAQFSAQLKDEGGAAGSQVTLETLQQDIKDTFLGLTTGTEKFDSDTGEPIYAGPDQNAGQDALEIVTNPVVSKLQTLNYDDQEADVVAGSKLVSDSDGTAYVLSGDSASSGTLRLFGVDGIFADTDEFFDVRDLGHRGGEVDGDVVTPDDYGELDMRIEIQEGFDDNGFGAELADLGDLGVKNIDLNLSVFGNPNTDTAPEVHNGDLLASLDLISTDVGGTLVSLGEYAPIDYFDFIAVLEQLGDLVAVLEEAYPVLTQTLPVVNKSVSDLLGLTEGVDRAVAQARSYLLDQQELLGLEGDEVPTLTLQGMATALRGAFGLAETDGISLVIDVETVGDNPGSDTPYLTLDFNIEETISTTLGLDIDLGDLLPNLTSGKVLRADGTLGWGFKVGIALDNADEFDPSDFKLFNPEGGLDGTLNIFGDGAEGVGLVFLAQVGDAAVQVMDALVNIQLGFSMGGLDFSGTDGIKTLSDVGFGDFPVEFQLVPLQDFNVSIPLFDIAGGLTGFLGEISATGTQLLDDTASLVDGLVDTLDDFELPDVGLDFDPLQNLLLLTDAADLFFEIIQDLLDEATSIDIPIIGDKLADGARFIEGFRDQFINRFRQMIEFTNDIDLDDVTGFIYDFFVDVVGLDLLEDDISGIRDKGADLLNTFDDEIRWELHLRDTYAVDFDLGFDLGVPLLNLSSDVAVELGIEWALDIGLGVNREDGAFIILKKDYGLGETDDKGELEVRAFIDLPTDTEIKGTLGFLEVAIENNGSGLELLFGVDLSNDGGADETILPIADIGNLGFDVRIDGGPIGDNEHILDLALSVGINEVDILPKLTTNFMMDWSLDPSEEVQDLAENIIQKGLELLDFGAVQIDLTTLLGGFVGDVLSGINGFLGPLLDISDFLDEDIPIISQLFGPTSLLDLAELLGLADTRLFEALNQIGDILDIVGVLDGSAFITLGDLKVFDVDDFDDLDLGDVAFLDDLFDQDIDFTKAIEDNFNDVANFLTDTVQGGFNTFNDAIDDAITKGGDFGSSKSTLNSTTNLSVGGAGDIISLPWVDDPKILLGLLVGQDVSLIEIDLPPLGVGFDYEQFVTIFGPLGVSIGFGFFVGADFSAGFNTYGLNRFADSEFTNPGLIFDGFFLGDRENVTEGTDIEELFLEMTLTAAAELNLGVASGGVGGGITARLGLDLYDPDDDGAVHISELINTIEHELRTSTGTVEQIAFKAARSIFDLTGSISAELFWYLKILFAKFGDTIFGPEVVFEFEIPFERTPILGTEISTTGSEDPDTLIINAGPNSLDRLNGDVADGNESFEVELQGSNIAIKSTALGVNDWQVYDKGYNHIIFIGGEGNDSITFTGFDESIITFDLRGGAGDDVIEFVENPGVMALQLATGAGAVIRGGAGNDRLIGSHLNDEIYGELGNDTIEGGRGYDILIGDSATLRDGTDTDKTIGARVSNLDGDDNIKGGDSDDIIIGGGGIDTISGGAGADVILGDGGRFGYDLGSPHINVGAFNIPTFSPNDRLDPEPYEEPLVSTAKQIDNILLALQGIFTGTDLGDGGNDIIDGDDGNDIIFGGAGNDDISGGENNDHVVGGRGFDEIDGDGDDDVLFGNEQDDIINGGAGVDVIAGGFGDDTLHGDADNDYMTGSRGRDIMFGDGGDDEMHGEGEPDIMFGGADNDLVIGGMGADIMMGDSGVVVKFDVDGETDLVIGDDSGTVVSDYEAAAGAGDIDAIVGSLDLILTDVLGSDGNDILSGGEGGDIMLGGGGNDLGGGDVDPRLTTANTSEESTPDGDDVMIGDGGIVEFNQRRLQRIASVFTDDPGGTYRDTLYGDNGDDIIIGGRGSDGDNNGGDLTLNIPSLSIGFILTGGHGPGRGATDDAVSDEDIIIGDNGELIYADDTVAENFGKLAYIQTTDVEDGTGGADTAYGELGDDIILGGVNGSVDVLNGSLGEDVILGDNGIIHFSYDWESESFADRVDNVFVSPDDDIATIDLIRSYNDGLGGIDIISGNAGVDVLLGGKAGDTIYGDDVAASAEGTANIDGGDVILGDNGDLFLAGSEGQLVVQGNAVDYITTTDVANSSGGNDTISGNAGADVILGGVNEGIGNDVIFGDADTQGGNDLADLILGDNGILLFNYDWTVGGNSDDGEYTETDGNRLTLDLVRSFTDNLGGADIISGDVGGDMILGGNDGDTIHGDDAVAEAGADDGDDIILGDNGDVFFNGDAGARILLGSAVQLITTRDESEATGGDDLIEGNAGNDIILGGVNDGGIDRLYGDAQNPDIVPNPNRDGDDIILGDNGLVNFGDDGPLPEDLDLGDLDLIQTIAGRNLGLPLGGVDYIFGNAGTDTALGGSYADRIFGDNDELIDQSGIADLLGQGAAADILIGDQGEVLRENDLPTLIQTTDTSVGPEDTEIEGGADHIQGNDGADIILGGVAGDELHGEAALVGLNVSDLVGSNGADAGDDTILGDEGRLWFSLTDADLLVVLTAGEDVNAMGDGDPNTLDRIETFDTGIRGGNDLIHGNGGADLAMGGSADDTIYGDFYQGSLISDPHPGNDQLLGDGGESTYIDDAQVVLRTIEPSEGGVDTIEGNDHDDVIMGGMFGDLLYGETDVVNLGVVSVIAGNDTILGDNGRLDWILPDVNILDRMDVFLHQGESTLVDLDGNPATLDRITTTDPIWGGDDVIYGNGNPTDGEGDLIMGGTGNDHAYGDTGDDVLDAHDGPDGSDLLFGDHGVLFPNLPELDAFFINNNFFSIDTSDQDGANTDGVPDGHKDFRDVIWGNAASDILIGGQDDDILFGGTQDDDLIGGHNVAGGHDELDDMPLVDRLAITPAELADLNPADVNEINDIMDGGEDDDVLAGDNAIIIRQLDDLSPRFRMTEIDGLLYVLESNNVDNLADVDVGFSANVTDAEQPHQDMDLVRTITLLDHSEKIETAAAEDAALIDPRVFGNDVMAGSTQDDEMFGQLGDDIIQGDGAISLTTFEEQDVLASYNPAQGADQSFDARDFTPRDDLVVDNDTELRLRFDVFEHIDDGDDYIEGNGGNDRIYGNLGQDDIIGGSSSLFGLSDEDTSFHGIPNPDPENDPLGLLQGYLLRPDGADLIYGGAGNPALLARNAAFGAPDPLNDVSDGDTIVPDAERHATDADTILGDNGDVFRIVVPDADPETDGDQLGYAVFNYDQDATSASGFQDFGYGTDDLTIRVRAVDLGDYGYAYADVDNNPETRETLEFLATARGEGDLIYGESGDDAVHGMTGDDVIFGGSEHDDLYGEIGSDFLLGGTGIDGIVGDDGLILTSRNNLSLEPLYGIDALLPAETGLKRNESPSPNSLNAEISSPGNIQRAIINVENELIKGVELFAFRTDDLVDENATIGEDASDLVGEFDALIRFNDIIFGGLHNDFIHSGAGDDAVSGAEALEAYYSGVVPEAYTGVDNGFATVNGFLQLHQSEAPDNPSALTDNPFWFDFAPYNPGDVLVFEGKTVVDGNGQKPSTRDEFFLYDEFNPRRRIMLDNDGLAVALEEDAVFDFILNFDQTEGELDTRFSDGHLPSDGDDRIFGDLGNDWIVGGTGRDHMYGGRGFDLLNMDDDHDSGFSGRIGPHDDAPDPLDNKDSDEYQAYGDIVYSGAGRDVMILNTGADRAIDWVGEYNSYIVPFSPFGAFHISRSLQPQVPEFLYALSASDGIDVSVDETLTNTNTLDGQLYVDQKTADVRTDTPEEERAFEPYGELGMVRQTDFDWQEQTGAPNDPQPGNLQGKREIMRRELFNDNAAEVPLAADVGLLSLTGSGTLQAAPEAQGGEVVGLYPLQTQQPLYTEVLVTINADKDRAGNKSNGYVIFDYQGAEDFKFAGIDVGTDKLQIGHRDASGWVIDTQTQVRLRANTDYDLTVVLFGSQATVYVNEKQNVSLDFNEPLNNGGMIGLGTDNATARFDDLQIQTLPPEWTFSNETGLNSDGGNPFITRTGDWSVSGGRLQGASNGGVPAVATDAVDVATYSRLEMQGDLATDGQGGFVFDYSGGDEFKYVALDAENNEVLIGHYVNGQYVVDAAVDFNVKAGRDYTVTLTMFGSIASVAIDGQSVLTHSFNSLLNDGLFGVLDVSGGTSFDDFLVRGDDPAYAEAALTAASSAVDTQAGTVLQSAAIETAAAVVIAQLDDALNVDESGLAELPIDVADLPGDQLAVWQGDRIVLDHNAAGHGWYTGASSAVDGIDLLSVLLHEYGHAVGLEHDSGLAFMADELGVGERFEVPGADAVLVFDEDTGEFVARADDGVVDDVLVYDSAELASEGDTDGVIHWRSTTGFVGRTLQLR